MCQEQIIIFPSADNSIDRKWANWLMSIMYAPFCFEYITLFLRLDYSISNRHIGSSGGHNTLPLVLHPPIKTENDCGTLVPPPTSIPPFTKPYCTAAWAGYVAAALCLAILCSAPIPTGLPLIRMDDCDIFGFYMVFLAPPIICTFVMILALIRGELAEVWAYEEKWNQPKQEVVQVVVEPDAEKAYAKS